MHAFSKQPITNRVKTKPCNALTNILLFTCFAVCKFTCEMKNMIKRKINFGKKNKEMPDGRKKDILQAIWPFLKKKMKFLCYSVILCYSVTLKNENTSSEFVSQQQKKNDRRADKKCNSAARAWRHNSDKQTSRLRQTNPEWQTIAFFKRVSLQYSKTTFSTRKLYLHSLYFSQNMLMLSEPGRVPVICILFLDFTRFAIPVM